MLLVYDMNSCQCPLWLSLQTVHARTIEAYNAKLEQKRVEFVKLKEDNAALKAANADLTVEVAVSI